MMLLLVELKVANGTSTGLNWIYKDSGWLLWTPLIITEITTGLIHLMSPLELSPHIGLLYATAVTYTLLCKAIMQDQVWLKLANWMTLICTHYYKQQLHKYSISKHAGFKGIGNQHLHALYICKPTPTII